MAARPRAETSVAFPYRKITPVILPHRRALAQCRDMTTPCRLAVPFLLFGCFACAIQILERVSAPDSLDVAASLNNLAELYRTEGKYQEAESVALRAVEIDERRAGSDSPDVAGSLHTLAAIYRDTGRYDEALSLLERSLAIREKAFGSEHLLVATTLGNIGEL